MLAIGLSLQTSDNLGKPSKFQFKPHRLVLASRLTNGG